MNVWLILTMDDFVWLLFFSDFSTKDGWVFSLVVWLQSISGLTSWRVTLGSGLSMLEVWTVASVLQGGFCVIVGCWRKLFDLFDCLTVSRLRTNSNIIVSMFIWFCFLEWMIYPGKSIWCDLLTLKIHQVEGTVLVSVRIFLNKIITYRLKRW